MPLRVARFYRRDGPRAPSRCMCCSHFGRERRKGWSGDLHMGQVNNANNAETGDAQEDFGGCTLLLSAWLLSLSPVLR